MAEVVVTTPQNPLVTDKNTGTAQTHGLPTPGSTPEPETARIKADEERQRVESQNANAQRNPASVESVPKPEDKSGDGDKSAATGDTATGDAATGNAATGDAATTSNKPDGMEGVEKTTPRPERTHWHLKAYKSCGEILGVLVNEPESTDLIKQLDTINNSIREYNTNNGFSKDQFVIDYSPYIPAFKEAAPYRATLATKRDKDAKDKLESINKGLEEHNKKHDYPSDWIIAIPEPPPRQRKVTPRGERRALTVGKALTFNESPGHVYDRGVEKQVAGYVRAGFGHRLLLRQDGQNDYDIYELVRASKFGKNFIDRNQDVLKGKEMKVGTKKDLEGKNFKNVSIFGVAPVRTDSDDEAMLMVWLQFPREQPLWYWRSWLGDKFGLDMVDEVLNMYREQAGQRPRRSARSISLGEGDTTDEDGEVEDTEDSEDDGGLNDEDKLRVLMKEVANLQKRLKSGNKSSRKSKSKRAK